jgi:nucleotide-binding universal stress UspA family protein
VKRILVATDFSPGAERALAVTARLARGFEASVGLLHVHPPLPLGGAADVAGQLWGGAEIGGAFAHESRELLEKARARWLGDVPDVRIFTRAGESASTAICATAAEADLCVVGTHGRTGVAHLVLGSVAEQVVRHAPCPVLAVRPTVDPQLFPQKILCATDFSPAADVGLEQAAMLGTHLGAAITVVNVYETERPPFSDRRGARSLGEVERELRGKLAELCRQRFSFAVGREVLVAATAADAIVEHAHEQGFDLIVVASRGLAGLSRLLLGSVAEKVTRHASCPVWTARRRLEAPSA